MVTRSAKLKSVRAANLARSTIEEDIEIINAAGGSDRVCMGYVDYYHSDRERLIRLRCGLPSDDDKKLPRSVVGTAAINSMMMARRQIADGHDDEVTANRLKIAEEAFSLSWLHIDDGDLDHVSDEEKKEAFGRAAQVMLETQDSMKALSVLPHKKVCDDRYRKGQEALEAWRQHDPYGFTFLVDIEIKTAPRE